ncbi:MAG TPA: CBS domain-containing protein [Candidatus Binatia bacterium]|nr:CBS domain-containing protein [Candidatus Binatia bacterium]
MLIDEWMVRPVHAAKPLDSIRHAREVMSRHRVNQLPVVRGDKLVGIITDRDLRDAFPSVFEDADREMEAERAERRGARVKAPPDSDPSRVTVDLVMTHGPFTMSPADTVEDAAAAMRTRRIGAVPIVDHGRLVGILTRSDVLGAFVALARGGAEAVGA